jgi:ribonuclease-3
VRSSCYNIDMSDLSALEARIGITFNNPVLLRRALTHHSCCGEESYDTLEFLGDAVIGLHVVEYIYRMDPAATEGEMTVLKSEVVSRRVLARIGLGLGLMEFIQVDTRGLRTFNDRSRESLCADVLEALVGAIYLDRGPEAAREFVAHVILPVVPEVKARLHENNPKGRLQQQLLQSHGLLPRYQVLHEGGRSNDREFTVGVYAGSHLLAVGKASSIKEAGRAAARAALQALAEQADSAATSHERL